MGRARLGHYLLGIEGLALVRDWLVADPACARARVAETRKLLAGFDAGVPAIEIDVPELEVRTGYAAWSETYDATPNPLIRVEEPVVRRLIDETPVGRALDAACGTGRHAGYLRARGHQVVGVDATPEMLARARAAHPGVDFRVGSLTALPLDTASVDLAVCALALCHVTDLASAMVELARVVRPGGRVIVSEFHPLMYRLGGQVLFRGSDGAFALVRSRGHGVGDYVRAAVASGLEVRDCFEPCWGEDEARITAGPLYDAAPEAFRAALVGLPGAVVFHLRRR